MPFQAYREGVRGETNVRVESPGHPEGIHGEAAGREGQRQTGTEAAPKGVGRTERSEGTGERCMLC